MLCDKNRLTGNRRCDTLKTVKRKDTSLLSVEIYIDIKGGYILISGTAHGGLCLFASEIEI